MLLSHVFDAHAITPPSTAKNLDIVTRDPTMLEQAQPADRPHEAAGHAKGKI
jgi:hypothetical protein